jgi:N-acetylglucosaminyldiphosphoundecaprenol N-acetyl-beta-D-mannosaminyltransferase
VSRLAIAEVPIDRVDMEEAMGRLGRAMAGGDQVQVATVNLDFLVRAQRQPELRAVLGRTELNVADGMPVVWLSRLAGQRVPARVAGADMAPLLVAEAERQGAGVFLLGGEHGVAEVSARRLRREHPGLRSIDWYEPPRARLDDMDNEAMIEMVGASGAELLLVALGNPKQEFWIDRFRDRLPSVRVAIGVGCVFDLWAERVYRAPGWMQRMGLEWLHRLLAEPRRLAGRHAAGVAWLLLLAGRSLVQRVTTANPAVTPRSAS